jgi:hypothetical protein
MLRQAMSLAGSLLLGVPLLVAQVPPEERIAITDPDRLEELGLRRDARQVYNWSRADRKGTYGMDPEGAEPPQAWGGGNYCPDRAVTRGERAVYLARALGLHWP